MIPVWSLAMFAWLFGVMIWCAFGVVRHADALAELLGEPYGTLILTVSIISIEVTILATIMLGGSPNPTLPRETMFAILMIVLNGMVGTVLAIGGLRHVQQQYNLQGATTFLAVLTPAGPRASRSVCCLSGPGVYAGRLARGLNYLGLGAVRSAMKNMMSDVVAALCASTSRSS
jgi:hypothetical protein